MDLFNSLFSSDGFMPHGHCYLWKPGLVALQVVSNSLIGLSYVAISVTIGYLVSRIRNIPFQWMYLAFGLFIISCGFTHFFDIWTVWDPIYWMDGVVRAITAVASLGTALLLPSLVPKAVALAQGARLAQEKGIELEAAYQQLGKVFEKTKELDELKTQFFGNVSHELRTPLALILGPVEKLQRAGNLSADQQRDLEIIGRNAKTLLKHVNDLLDVAKLEAGKASPQYFEADLAKLIRLTASNFDALAEERGIFYSFKIPESFMVQIDPDMIQRVLVNLISNAFKFTPDRGTITIELKAQNGRAEIFVGDSGPGVPPALRESVFERFRQLEGGTTRRFGGTGLGLSIAKEFVELHRGRISVGQSAEGGALFWVELPVMAPENSEVKPASRALLKEDAALQEVADLREFTQKIEALLPELKSKKGLVLVVEDNRDMNRFVSDTLATQYDVISAFDGREGLEKALNALPDLILTDVMMPRMGGDQLVKEARAHAQLSDIPIILLTAKADDDLRVQLLREGAQDYVMKPFLSAELLARVQNLVTLKKARQTLQNELSSQLKDLEALTQEVTVRRKELQQTAENLRLAKDEAERASAAKTTFLNMVSHEVRTPITSLQLQLELLKRSTEKVLTDSQKQLVSKLFLSSKRSLELMDSLLEYTKIQSGKIIPKTENIDLDSLLAEIVDSFQVQAQQKGLTLHYQKPEFALPILRGDSVLTRLIVRNLVSNAIKYTEKGSVQVYVSWKESAYRICVKDTGPGIPAEGQKIIFEPFQQLESLAKKTQSGFGLGLALAKEVIHLLGGNIDVESELGQGSLFTATLPASPATAKA